MQTRSFPLMLAGLLAAASCSDNKQLNRGQLIIALSTDMSITKDLDEVRVQVFREDGTALPDRQIPIIPAEEAPFGKPLPGTLAIVPSDSGGQQLLIRVSGRRVNPKNGVKETRVTREAVIKVPTDRVAMLRMPLRWLCDGQVEKIKGSDDDSYRSACDDDQTCVAGSCVPSDVDADALPDYAPELVFGGGDELGQGSTCLDVPSCFGAAAILTPDGDCTVTVPDGARNSRLNVALVLPPKSDGHCLDTKDGAQKGNCYLPLDNDEAEGFYIERGSIVLPEAACGRDDVLGVAVSTACPSKDLSTPVCGPWTGWHSSPSETGTGGAPSNGSGGAAAVAGTGTNATGGKASAEAGAPGRAGASSFGGVPASAGAASGGASSGAVGNVTGTGGAANDYACQAEPVQTPLITSFAAVTESATGFTVQDGLPGGFYSYMKNALTLSPLNGELHVSGNVADYDGFGMYLNACSDLSSFKGIAFKLRGSVGSSATLNFRVQTNEDLPVDDVNMKGTCVVPNGTTDTFPLCHAPSVDIPVPAAADAAVVTVPFSDLSGGLPQSRVNSRQIVGFEWSINWDPAQSPFDADIWIDDIKLVSQ